MGGFEPLPGKVCGTAAERGVVYVVLPEVWVCNACEGARRAEAYALVVDVLEKAFGVVGDLEAVKDPFGSATDVLGDTVDAVGVLFDKNAELFCLLDWGEVGPRRVL